MKSKNTTNSFSAFSNDSIAPSACFDLLFEKTDSNGKLVLSAMPADTYDDSPKKTASYVICWDKKKCDELHNDFDQLIQALEKLAQEQDALKEKDADPKKILSQDLYLVYDTYVRPYKVDGIDNDRIFGINAKMEDSEEPLSEEEECLMEKYEEGIRMDAQKRIGGKYAAYNVIQRAKRLHMLYVLTAPKIVYHNEQKYLAEAMLINRFAVEMK